MTNLTPKQQRIYDFIRTFTRRQGYPPTLREIGQAVGEVLERFSCDPSAPYTLEQVEETDRWAREAVLEYCGRG